MNLVVYLRRQCEWSERTFGPGARRDGLIDHIVKELREIVASPPGDLSEWIDVIILALDGAWREGHTPEEVVAALQKKQEINFARKWGPDRGDGRAIEHIREES